MIAQDVLQLTQAGIIAIPIEQNEDLKPSPNFLIFDNQFGKTKAPFTNLQTGEIEEADCVMTTYKIVNREILEPTVAHPNREMIERSLLPLENLAVPVDLLTLFFSHQRIKDNVNIVNLALSKFSFRGSLSELVLKVDETVLDSFIEQPL
jgi:hypothetical protein